MTVFLVIPAKFLGSHSRWLRMMVSVALLGATREGERSAKIKTVPVVWMLDELAQLGYLKAVAEGFALLRGYGYRIWGVFQDLPQLRDIYGERGKSMLSSSIVQGFNINCLDTAKWFSDIAGVQMSGGYSSDGPMVKPILREDEVRSLSPDTELIKLPGEKLFTCKKLVSWRDRETASLLDPDPYQ
jgi:type IV secretion system protein VirD4